MHETIERHYNTQGRVWLKRAIHRMGNQQDGEDILHDAYTNCIKYYDPENPPLVFEAWFARVFFNAMNNHKRMNFGQSLESDDDEESIDCNAYNAEVVRDIYDLIATKSEDTREKLYLHFKYGYTSADICAIAGGAPKSTRQLLWRFRDEIREKFG